MPPGLYEEMLSIGGMDPVHWISKEKPENPPKCLTWYPDFDKARSGLRYFLLKAYPNERKKDVDFSRRLALCLYIRREVLDSRNGVRVVNLSERTGCGRRTILRCLNALMEAGEPIDYDKKTQKWYWMEPKHRQ